jgi:hypothetical protein
MRASFVADNIIKVLKRFGSSGMIKHVTPVATTTGKPIVKRYDEYGLPIDEKTAPLNMEVTYPLFTEDNEQLDTEEQLRGAIAKSKKIYKQKKQLGVLPFIGTYKINYIAKNLRGEERIKYSQESEVIRVSVCIPNVKKGDIFSDYLQRSYSVEEVNMLGHVEDRSPLWELVCVRA